MITSLAGWTYAGTEAGLPVFYAETEADVEELRKKWGNRAIIRLSPTLYERYRVQEIRPLPSPPPEAEVPPHPEVKKAITIIKRKIIKKPPVRPPAPTPTSVKPPIFKYLLLASLLVGGLGIILYLKKKK